MAKIQLASVDNMTNEEIHGFFEKYKNFMKNSVVPSHIGAKTLSFTAEVADGGYIICAETNQQLNMGSKQKLYNLTKGYIAGWKDKP